MTPEERVIAGLREHKACCSPREVKAVLALLAEEREACARIVEQGYVGNRVETDVGDMVRAKAAAIRARTV